MVEKLTTEDEVQVSEPRRLSVKLPVVGQATTMLKKVQTIAKKILITKGPAFTGPKNSDDEHR